jgi:hypothetical protein
MIGGFHMVKRTSWVVAFYPYASAHIEYRATYACSAQEAVDIARYEWNVYEVVECYKKVANWS